MKPGAFIEPSVQQRKSLHAVIAHFLGENVHGCHGELIRNTVAAELVKLIDTCLPSTERLRPGLVLWLAVDANESAGYGKHIEDCALVPVILDLITHDDLQAFLDKVPYRRRLQQVAVRLHQQAFAQGGVLSYEDTAALLKLAPGTVGTYIRAHEMLHQCVVPRRGNVHDLGPTLTHKRIICLKHLREGLSVEDTARHTHHSTQAVTRYVQDFKRVYLCLKEGIEYGNIPFATGLSKPLVKQYCDMIEQWDLETADEELPF